MINIKTFVFNPMFQVNTYVLYDHTEEAVIIDAACYEENEKEQILRFFDKNQLKPVKLINTHCHVDHILGNDFIERKFGLKPIIHKAGEIFLTTAKEYAVSFGLQIDRIPMPENYISEGGIVKFGDAELEVLYIPGHADGSICLVNHESKSVFAGDVIFDGSIGRTDLPTGNTELLLQGIKEKLFQLPEDYTIYCGHGPGTTIGKEKQTNPFMNE